MRIECSQCQKLFEAESALALGEEVGFACAHCGADIVLPVQRPVPESAPEESPTAASESERRCPKCSSPVQEAGTSCSSCGLAAERFDSYEDSDGHRDQELADGWERVVANWEDDGAHEGFAKLLAAKGDYRGGAAHYRETAANPDRAQRSQEMLERIQRMAAAAALVPSEAKQAASRGPVVLLMFLVLAAGAGVTYLMIKQKQHSQEPVIRPPQAPGSASSPGPSEKR